MKSFFVVSGAWRSVLVIASVIVTAHCAQVDGSYPGAAADSGHRMAGSGRDGSAGARELVGGDSGTHSATSADSLLALGEMYVGARHCAACHQSDNPADGILSGSLTPIPSSPKGVVGYGPNLTPDADTGIGGWSDEQIIRAMRMGLDDEGVSMCVMPHFGDMGDAEAAAIVAYLRSLPAIARTVTDSTCPDDLALASNGADAGVPLVDPVMSDAGEPMDTGVRPDASRPTEGGVIPRCTPVLVINEIQSSGTGGAGDEFVEIYNDSDCGASLSAYELKYASATGATSLRRWAGGASDRIAARGYILIAGMGFTGGATPIGWFATAGGTLASTGGGVGLFDPAGILIDGVGYGASSRNPLIEGSPAPAPASGQAIARTPDGSDSNDNSLDFALASAPTPGAANR